MENLISFINAFLSYFLVFIIAVALMVSGAFIGIAMRKKKNAREETMSNEEATVAEN